VESTLQYKRCNATLAAIQCCNEWLQYTLQCKRCNATLQYNAAMQRCNANAAM
jgi:hypothetical protein